MPKRPEISAGALIFNSEGKVFLMKSHKWSNKYVLPGGHVEFGEKIESALKREIKEETKLNIYDLNFLTLDEIIFSPYYEKKTHFISPIFLCKTDTEEVKLSSEAEKFVWVYPKEALNLDLEPFARRAIERYLKKKE